MANYGSTFLELTINEWPLNDDWIDGRGFHPSFWVEQLDAKDQRYSLFDCWISRYLKCLYSGSDIQSSTPHSDSSPEVGSSPTQKYRENEHRKPWGIGLHNKPDERNSGFAWKWGRYPQMSKRWRPPSKFVNYFNKTKLEGAIKYLALGHHIIADIFGNYIPMKVPLTPHIVGYCPKDSIDSSLFST